MFGALLQQQGAGGSKLPRSAFRHLLRTQMRGQLHDRFIERVFLVLCAAGQRWMEIDDYAIGMALLNKGSYEDKLKRMYFWCYQALISRPIIVICEHIRVFVLIHLCLLVVTVCLLLLLPPVFFAIFDIDDDGFISAHDLFTILEWQFDAAIPDDFAVLSRVAFRLLI